jgi:predicted helicase
MASYAMAHFKLDMKLKETGYTFKDDSRLRVYLTNSLEEPPNEVPELFMEKWLAEEANEANGIKNNTPVMVVLGNPPYSGESANITADDFLANYKKEPGGIDKLKERNSKWLNDDYVKFIRYGQNFIEKYGEGVLAYINNHSFLDNPTFRGMRWNLLDNFDKIYILDLHGNSKKKETAPDGSKDENVFDIQVGVSVNLLIKTGKK